LEIGPAGDAHKAGFGAFGRQERSMSALYTETALSAAFLKALTKSAECHTGNDRIAIPTGTVTAAELVRVLRTLRLTRESESTS
jgi:hypothetical protein